MYVYCTLQWGEYSLGMAFWCAWMRFDKIATFPRIRSGSNKVILRYQQQCNQYLGVDVAGFDIVVWQNATLVWPSLQISQTYQKERVSGHGEVFPLRAPAIYWSSLAPAPATELQQPIPAPPLTACRPPKPQSPNNHCPASLCSTIGG